MSASRCQVFPWRFLVLVVGVCCMLSLLLALTGVAVSGGSLLSHWLSSSATFASTIAS